jgi:hypothetical protein
MCEGLPDATPPAPTDTDRIVSAIEAQTKAVIIELDTLAVCAKSLGAAIRAHGELVAGATVYAVICRLDNRTACVDEAVGVVRDLQASLAKEDDDAPR